MFYEFIIKNWTGAIKNSWLNIEFRLVTPFYKINQRLNLLLNDINSGHISLENFKALIGSRNTIEIIKQKVEQYIHGWLELWLLSSASFLSHRSFRSRNKPSSSHREKDVLSDQFTRGRSRVGFPATMPVTRYYLTRTMNQDDAASRLLDYRMLQKVQIFYRF